MDQPQKLLAVICILCRYAYHPKGGAKTRVKCLLTVGCGVWGETIDCEWTLLYLQGSRDEEVTWEHWTPSCEPRFSSSVPTVAGLAQSGDGMKNECFHIYRKISSTLSTTKLSIPPSVPQYLREKQWWWTGLWQKLQATFENLCNGWTLK